MVDDHELFRNGLAKILSDRGILVAGVASSGEEALESIPRLRPNVVLMDLSLPGMSGVDVTRRLLAALPGACVVALTVVTDEETLLQRSSRACTATCSRMRPSTRSSRDRGRCTRGGLISPQLTGNLMRSIREPFCRDRTARAADSARARNFDLLVEGYDNAEITERLSQPVHGEEPCASILEKLGVHNRLQAACRGPRWI